jgi:hypothetical protein
MSLNFGKKRERKIKFSALRHHGLTSPKTGSRPLAGIHVSSSFYTSCLPAFNTLLTELAPSIDRV